MSVYKAHVDHSRLSSFSSGRHCLLRGCMYSTCEPALRNRGICHHPPFSRRRLHPHQEIRNFPSTTLMCFWSFVRRGSKASINYFSIHNPFAAPSAGPGVSISGDRIVLILNTLRHRCVGKHSSEPNSALLFFPVSFFRHITIQISGTSTDGEVAQFAFRCHRTFIHDLSKAVLQQAQVTTRSEKMNPGVIAREDSFVSDETNMGSSKERPRTKLLVPLCGDEARMAPEILEKSILKWLRGFSREHELTLEEAVNRYELRCGTNYVECCGRHHRPLGCLSQIGRRHIYKLFRWLSYLLLGIAQDGSTCRTPADMPRRARSRRICRRRPCIKSGELSLGHSSFFTFFACVDFSSSSIFEFSPRIFVVAIPGFRRKTNSRY